MNQIPTEITAGKFGNGNGNTDILKAIITTRHLSFQYCADCNIVLPRMRSNTSEVGYEQIYSLDMPLLDCYYKNPGPEGSGRKNFKIWTRLDKSDKVLEVLKQLLKTIEDNN
jgi:hypothetical protein